MKKTGKEDERIETGAKEGVPAPFFFLPFLLMCDLKSLLMRGRGSREEEKERKESSRREGEAKILYAQMSIYKVISYLCSSVVNVLPSLLIFLNVLECFRYSFSNLIKLLVCLHVPTHYNDQ